MQLLALRAARLVARVRAEGEFKLLSGEGATTEYQFNKHVIHHLFCSTCGIQSFAHGKGPDGIEMVAINARCLEGSRSIPSRSEKSTGGLSDDAAPKSDDGRTCAHPSRSQRCYPLLGNQDQTGHMARTR